ncbi:MAG: SUMF1/EgtB/PvdO family nonheme iron enzyme [Candidatus Methylacidiphilales bacterium]
MSNSPIPVILAYPDPAITSYLESLLNHYQLPLDIRCLHQIDDLYAQMETMEDRFIVLCDLFWDGANASDILLSICLSKPRSAFCIVSNGPVAEYLPRDFPAPSMQGFEDTEYLVALFFSLLEDLRGQHLGPYQIQDFAGQCSSGQIYSALQPAIKRQVYLTIPYLHLNEQGVAHFRALAGAQAKNAYPAIYSIYEETEISGRRIIAQEPIDGPSLFQFQLEAATFDSRLIAKIIHTTAGALKHLHELRVPHPRIKSKHITLARNGVIKLHNIAFPDGELMPEPMEEVRLLADIVTPFIDPNQPIDPALNNLLQSMQMGKIDLAATHATANQIDIDLAPVKLVPERAQAKKAAVEVQKARKSFWMAAVIGGGALSAFLIFMTIYVINTYFLERPGRNFLNQMRIPAGEVVVSRNEKIQLPEFYMDEHEVTIGQYEKFLKDTARLSPEEFKNLLPPGDFIGNKQDFIPRDWKAMLHSVRRKGTYEGIGHPINRDMPIFNVDYADAYAYAKWAGKRLPSELEWQRAAAGNENFKLPWGNEADPKRANTGMDREKHKDGDPGSIDGFRGLAEVDKNEKTDVSPFGVKNMAGNVSEWVTVSPELGGNLESIDGAQRGGNHGYPTLVSNQKRLNYRLNTRQAWLGFRCVSDQPVTGPQL